MLVTGGINADISAIEFGMHEAVLASNRWLVHSGLRLSQLWSATRLLEAISNNRNRSGL
jgi:hypothetical protein